jgi:hypothetical protein
MKYLQAFFFKFKLKKSRSKYNRLAGVNAIFYNLRNSTRLFLLCPVLNWNTLFP